MKAGQGVVILKSGATAHITCSGARKGWTVCGKLVPRAVFVSYRGTVDALERIVAKQKTCANCLRMANASTT